MKRKIFLFEEFDLLFQTNSGRNKLLNFNVNFIDRNFTVRLFLQIMEISIELLYDFPNSFENCEELIEILDLRSSRLLET